MKVLVVIFVAISVALAEPPVPSSQYIPANQYIPPSNQYGAPRPFALSPSNTYGAPAHTQAVIRPNNQYGPPKSEYGPPKSEYGPPGGTYLPPNGGYGSGKGYDDQSEPANYQFEYQVQDPPSGNDFGHEEARQGDVAKGKYFVLLPDGRLQTVEYTADLDGYKPKISYEQVSNGGYASGGPGGYASGGPGGYQY